jgi:putative tryptophan/tyrosine transport system substrate-binding protein
MKRRDFITLLGGAATWPIAARAQQASIPLVGLLLSSSAAANARLLDAFRSGMLELGYVEGRNTRYEYRFADGHLDRLPDLAIALVRLKPDVIVSAPLPSHIALRQATSTIPIVMANGADPVGFGLVTSLSHPGGNVTGLANFAEVLAAKQIEASREPGLDFTECTQSPATEVCHESQRRDAQGSRLGQSRHSCHRTREIDA